jgi:hypothetical protein
MRTNVGFLVPGSRFWLPKSKKFRESEKTNLHASDLIYLNFWDSWIQTKISNPGPPEAYTYLIRNSVYRNQTQTTTSFLFYITFYCDKYIL